MTNNRRIVLVVLGGCLFLPPSFAQSLGEVARASKASKKTAHVVTNDTLPESRGPANGAALSPETKAALKEPPPENGNASQSSARVTAENGAEAGEQAPTEKDLRERIRFLSQQIAALNTRLESETNEASRDAIKNLAETYQKQRDQSQQQLDALLAAKSKSEPVEQK